MTPWLFLRLVAALALGTALAAQGLPPGRQLFRTYAVEQGLENLAVSSVVQDAQGFIWAGTEGNLFRYDGAAFQSFGIHEGLPSSHVTALLPTPQGPLWVGTWRGLVRYVDGHLQVIQPQQGLPDARVLGLQLGPGGWLWVASQAGLYVSRDGTRFEPAVGWPGGEATALWVAWNGEIWAASGAELRHFGTTGRWRTLGPEAGLGISRIDALVLDRKARLWVRSSRELWVLPAGADRFQDRSRELPAISKVEGALFLDRRDRLWVPTERGLACLEGDRWSLLGPPEGLPTGSPRAVLLDREGTLWVAGQGLHRELGRGAWRAYTPQDGLSHDTVWTIWRSSDGTLWVGTDRGLCRAGPRGWERLPGTEAYAIRTVVETPDGALWMGGSGSEVLRWDPHTKRLQRFGSEEGLRGRRVLRLLVDRHGTLWAGLDGGGLLQAQSAGSRWRFRREDLPEGWPTERISHLLEDRWGRLWVCGEAGLACLEGGRWKRYTQKDGLERSHVAYIVQRLSGEFQVAYFEALGISILQADPGEFRVTRHLGTAQGLSSDKIYLMGEDARRRFWAGTGHGVDLFDASGVQHFGASDGLVGEDCDAMAFHGDPDGTVWIGTSSGLAHYLPPATEDAEPPATALTLATLGGEPLDLDPKVPLRVDGRHNTFEVHFAGLSFLNEARVEHQVCLLGLEPEWQTTRQREARYPVLGPRAYEFRVRSRINHGPWGPPAILHFEVLPAWWQRPILKVLAALALVALGGWIARWRLEEVHRRNSELEALLKLVEVQTKDLEHANRALMEQSLTDPLTGLRNRRYLDITMPEVLAQVQRNHREATARSLDGQNLDLLFILVDVDHFKTVNDTHGHGTGDVVLQQLAHVLRGATRESDTVVRWGGEEFLVVARHTNRRDAPVLAERIRASVEAHPFDMGNHLVLDCTCSIGFAPYPVDSDQLDRMSWEKVVDLADECLYKAKRGGRNRWIGLLPPEPVDRASEEASDPGFDVLTEAGPMRQVAFEGGEG